MLYFAYGSNLNLGDMELRCRDALPLYRATLPGYELVFRGVADIFKNDAFGKQVEGAVYEISEADEHWLDCYEGVSSGLYAQIEIDIIRHGDGLTTKAMTYQMSPGRAIYEPSDLYLRRITDGYADWKMDFNPLLMAVKAVQIETTFQLEAS